MIEAFETGLDVHSLTASLISGLPYQRMIDEDKAAIYCQLGSGDKSWRFWGKKANHGLNYNLGYRKFSLTYEIPENDGKFIVEKYHRAYPEVREVYHKYVIQQLSNGRTITNLMGRRTMLLDEWGDRLFNKGFSCIPQGTVGDVINERGLEYIYYNPDRFSPVRLLMQVHDSINFEIPLNIGFEEHARILLDIKRSLETPLITPHGHEFVIPADISMGYNLYKDKHMRDIKASKCPADILSLAAMLENINEELTSKR
jgi:DNA polymerase I-like protein with 3'-5' exonuclease and polymerase domains